MMANVTRAIIEEVKKSEVKVEDRVDRICAVIL
jgi:hypothetical protein